MVSVVDMRSNGTNGCRPLSMPPHLVIPKLRPQIATITVCATTTASATVTACSSSVPPPASPSVDVDAAPQPCGGKTGTVKSSRGLVERLQHRRSWHLNGARSQLASLSITLSTSTSTGSVACRRGLPSQLHVTVSGANADGDLGDLQSPTSRLESCTSRAERDELPELRAASQILPYLYIGSERDASDEKKLEALNIGYVLNVTGHLACHFEGQSGLVYERIPANDSERQDLKRYFQTAVEFIERARRSNVACLVHCVAGVSRSPTIVLAYLMCTRGWTMMEAYNFVKERRSWIAPNLNFVGQLYDFERELVRTNRLHCERPPTERDAAASKSKSTSISMEVPAAATTTTTTATATATPGPVRLQKGNADEVESLRPALSLFCDKRRTDEAGSVCVNASLNSADLGAFQAASDSNGTTESGGECCELEQELVSNSRTGIDSKAAAGPKICIPDTAAAVAVVKVQAEAEADVKGAAMDLELHEHCTAGAGRTVRAEPAESCRSAKRLNKYYAMSVTAAFSGSLVCGMETE